MPKMTAGDLKALLSAERYDALSAMAASKLSDERASALNYYMGNMSKDMPAPDGRSKAVSSDVADTIEGLMPPLMEIFPAGEEVVQFLHQGCAAFEGRRGQGVVGMPPGGRARDLSRSAG